MKKPVHVYKFKCGHVGPSKRVLSKNVCPKCGASKVGKMFVCVDCGVEFVSNGNDNRTCRCPKHQKEYRAECRRIYEKERYRKYKKAMVKKKMTFSDPPVSRLVKSHCLFYEHCLEFDLKKDKNACVCCQRYVHSNILSTYPANRKKSGASGKTLQTEPLRE